MNIYLFELKTQVRGFIVWTLAILLILFAFVGIYPSFSQSVDDIMKMISGYPPAFAAAFGLELSSMLSFGGFFGFLFSYIGLVGAIMATSIGISAFGREKRAKCIDFLLTKTISRESIFLAKLFSGLTLIIAANFLYIAAAMSIGISNGEPVGRMFLVSLSLLLTQLVFYAAGIAFAIFAKKIRSVAAIATAFGFGGFILSALANIIGEEYMRYIAPLQYFKPDAVIKEGFYDPRYAMTGVLIMVVCVTVAFISFRGRDAHAV